MSQKGHRGQGFILFYCQWNVQLCEPNTSLFTTGHFPTWRGRRSTLTQLDNNFQALTSEVFIAAWTHWWSSSQQQSPQGKELFALSDRVSVYCQVDNTVEVHHSHTAHTHVIRVFALTALIVIMVHNYNKWTFDLWRIMYLCASVCV